jgi:hypothetical protein
VGAKLFVAGLTFSLSFEISSEKTSKVELKLHERGKE